MIARPRPGTKTALDEPQRGFERGLIEADDRGRRRLVADERDGNRAETPSEQIAIGGEIVLDVSHLEWHAGS